MRPSCRACTANQLECVYPQDTRRLLRPSRDRIDGLEQHIASLWQHIASSQPSGSPLPNHPSLLDLPGDDAFQSPIEQTHTILNDTSPPAGPTKVARTMSTSQHPWPSPAASSSQLLDCESVEQPSYHSLPNAVTPKPSTSDRNSATQSAQCNLKNSHHEADSANASLSPFEAHIAGLDVNQDGNVSVHGASSMMHRKPTRKEAKRVGHDEESNRAATQARLVSNALLQRQRESYLYRGPATTVDLDGVDPELAKHLIDLHWNRQHFAYLLTYRPAVMDSLANGGPWCNKLLLNAIYYTSCLYSDREYLRSSPDDTQSAGDRFYERFRSLLVDEIVKPSIPSAAALLLTGAALVSQVSLTALPNLAVMIRSYTKLTK